MARHAHDTDLEEHDDDLASSGEARLFVEEEMAGPSLHRVAGGVAAVFSTRSPGKEPPNEDTAAIIPFDDDSGILVVADGLGGIPGGERASRMAVEALKSTVDEATRQGDRGLLRTAVINAIELANREVLALEIGAATTLAVVEIQNGEIRPYHVGDSMILVTGQRGKVKLQTISHSPVGYALESGLLDESEAMQHEDRHVVSNVIGDTEMRIELGPPLRLAARDTVLVSSDGLFDNLRTEEIIECACKGKPEEATTQLAQRALRRMNQLATDRPSKPDDLTIVLFRPGS